MVTGGDDLPVLALMLLGAGACATRRQPGLAGLAPSVCAGTLKLTAWRSALVSDVPRGVSDRQEGRPAPLRYLAALSSLLIARARPCWPALVSGSGGVLRRTSSASRSGSTTVKSPAASPGLLGQVLDDHVASPKTADADHHCSVLVGLGFAIVDRCLRSSKRCPLAPPRRGLQRVRGSLGDVPRHRCSRPRRALATSSIP